MFNARASVRVRLIVSFRVMAGDESSASVSVWLGLWLGLKLGLGLGIWLMLGIGLWCGLGLG